jgi:signal transduction histidine kinase
VTRRLLLTYLSITAFALVALVVPLGLTFARRERDRLSFDIERDAAAVASQSEDALEAGTHPPVDQLLARYRRDTDGRIVVVDRAGITVADSDHPGAAPRDYSRRPEIARALTGQRAVGSRHSSTLGSDLVYVAIPVASGGVVHGAVRVTFPSAARDARVRAAWLTLLALSGTVLTVVTAVGFLLARSVTRPVRAIETAVEAVAGGDLGARAPAGDGPPELRALAVTFNRTAARLEELVGAQQRFVADAAHQLRSPLTALRLRMENLDPALPPGARPSLDAALDEVQRLSRIVDGLLLLARGERAHAEVAAVDVAASVAGRVDAWREVAAEQGVALVGGDGGGVWALSPAAGIEQVLDNLLANALAVAPVGSTVAVRVVAEHDAVEVHVVDEGPGLDAEGRERAFDRFWRGSASTPGTGLGLPVVRQLARAAGGDAWLAPGPAGRGTDAVVRLPVGVETFTDP